MASYCSIHSSYLITVIEGKTFWKDVTPDRRKAADAAPAPAVVTMPITVRGHGHGVLLQLVGSAGTAWILRPTWAGTEQANVKATGFGFKGGENGPLERRFWLEMMDKYYHKLLSPPWAAAGVIYELLYGHRHAAAIARSSLQCSAGCSRQWLKGGKRCCTIPTAGKRQACCSWSRRDPCWGLPPG